MDLGSEEEGRATPKAASLKGLIFDDEAGAGMAMGCELERGAVAPNERKIEVRCLGAPRLSARSSSGVSFSFWSSNFEGKAPLLGAIAVFVGCVCDGCC